MHDCTHIKHNQFDQLYHLHQYCALFKIMQCLCNHNIGVYDKGGLVDYSLDLVCLFCYRSIRYIVVFNNTFSPLICEIPSCVILQSAFSVIYQVAINVFFRDYLLSI